MLIEKVILNTTVTKFPLPSDTRNALCDQRIALLLQHYLVIADWYDLCDPARRFSKTVCHLALHNELLFSAVIALAAMHFSITQSKSTRLTAEFYHDCCVQLLIDLHAENHQLRDGTALAAVCLLRSYEILDGEFGFLLAWHLFWVANTLKRMLTQIAISKGHSR